MNDLAKLVLDQAQAMNATMMSGYEAGVQAERARNMARLVELRGALMEALEFAEDQEDVVDGDYGIPAPNRAMNLCAMLREVLGIVGPRQA